MTSRERVRAVLNRQPADRIPNGLGGCETAGLHVVAYDTLQQLLGVPRTPPRLDTFMTNAVFELPVIEAMGGDIVLLASPRMCRSDLRGDIAGQWKEQELWGRTFSVPVTEYFTHHDDGTITWDSVGGAVCPKDAFFFDHISHTDLLADFGTPDPDRYHPSDTISDAVLEKLERTARQLYNETDLSICLGETITDLQVQPGGMIGAMVLMMEEPDIMREFLRKSAEAALKQIRLLDQAVGKYVDILSIAHDFGDNRGVTIGAPLWREIYKPYYKQLFTGWQSLTDMKVNLHSCGAISDIIGDLIECGMQVLNPVQISGANMSPESLKERFGDRVIFWGGAYDAQLIPVTATYEEVYSAVRKNIDILGQGGGFIFSGVHNLPATVPADHFRAMLDALRDSDANNF